jgi:hypothetical protein
MIKMSRMMWLLPIGDDGHDPSVISMNTGDPSMRSLIPGVHASSPARLAVEPSIELRAFLLRRASGNLLVYSSAALAGETAAIQALGGAVRHYLGHWHEAPFGHVELVAGLEVPLFCHEAERARVVRSRRVDGTFATRHRVDEDFEVIPIPGHTPGSTAFLWHGDQHRCLFTTDSVYLSDGTWIAALLEGSSDRAAYIESLALLREVEFDVLLPWAAKQGGAFHAFTDQADARRRLDAIIDRLRHGEDH